MKFSFETFLEKKGISEKELSASLAKKASDIRKVEGGIAGAKLKIEAGNLSVRKKSELEAQIAEAQAELPELDQALVAAIEKWIPKRAQYAAGAERLKSGKNGTAQGQQSPDTRTAPAANTAAAPSATKAQTSVPAKTSVKTPAATQAAEPKKIGTWGAVGIVLGIFGLLGGGIYFYNKQKNG